MQEVEGECDRMKNICETTKVLSWNLEDLCSGFTPTGVRERKFLLFLTVLDSVSFSQNQGRSPTADQ